MMYNRYRDTTIMLAVHNFIMSLITIQSKLFNYHSKTLYVKVCKHIIYIVERV